MIEDNFDVPFAARAALKEKQIQQAYRPIIAVHKWFARRQELCSVIFCFLNSAKSHSKKSSTDQTIFLEK